MKFRSRHLNLTVTVVPAEYILQGQHKRSTKALRAYFRGGVFDSEVAQQVYRWDEAERKQVEEYLLSHPDFDTSAGFWVDQGEQSWAEVQMHDLAGIRCIFVFRTESGGSEVCGKDVVPGMPYCQTHAGVAGWLDAQPEPKAAKARKETTVETAAS